MVGMADPGEKSDDGSLVRGKIWERLVYLYRYRIFQGTACRCSRCIQAAGQYNCTE